MQQDISFKNSKGSNLHGVLVTPETKHYPLVIICHGYASNTNSKTRVVLADKLLEHGIASFGFDFTGCGKSDGELFQLTITQGLDDLNAAYNYVNNLDGINKNKISLLGSSFSGAVAVLFAINNELNTLLLKSPVSNYNQIKEVPLVTRNKQQQFFDDAKKYDVYSASEKIKIPTIKNPPTGGFFKYQRLLLEQPFTIANR